MARPRLSDPARVTIGLKVSEAEAAQIDQVLARPEFAGWSRSEWCREIIQTALRYYARKTSAPDPAPARASARPAAAQPAAAEPASPRRSPVPPAARSPAPAPDVSGPAGATEPAAAAPEPPAQPECAHPPAARDYQRGICAACGAILWD